MKELMIKDLYKDCSSLITEQTQEIHKLILGYGNFNADIMFIAEAPTSKEEEQGTLFVERAKDKFDNFLSSLHLKKEDIYITNVVKYRPYKINELTGRVVNRTPKKTEIDFFLPYLQKEINIISPKIIVALGNLPLKVVMENNSLMLKAEHGKIRTKFIGNKEYKVLPLFHPSSLIYNKKSHKYSLNKYLIVLQHVLSYPDSNEENNIDNINEENQEENNIDNINEENQEENNIDNINEENQEENNVDNINEENQEENNVEPIDSRPDRRRLPPRPRTTDRRRRRAATLHLPLPGGRSTPAQRLCCTRRLYLLPHRHAARSDVGG